MPTVALLILRLLFVLVAAGLGAGFMNSAILPSEPAWIPWLVFAACLLASGGIIALDVVIRRKRLETMTAVYFGLLVGVLLTYVVRLALTPLLPDVNNPLNQKAQQIVYWVLLGVGTVLCYT